MIAVFIVRFTVERGKPYDKQTTKRPKILFPTMRQVQHKSTKRRGIVFQLCGWGDGEAYCAEGSNGGI